MKTLLTAAAMLFVATTTQAAPRLGFDGCYQLYMPGSMYPAFCLQGTAEEGINGAGVRLAMFGTNTDKVIKCMVSTSSGMSEDSFTFEVKGKKELIMENVGQENGRKVGDAVFGRTRLNFMEINDNDTDRLIKIANESCD